MTDIHDTADLVSKALRRAWLLGQTYWQQADSEYQSHWKKADATLDAFNQLIEDTRAAILTANSGAQPAPSDWPMLRDGHLRALCFAYEKGFAAGIDERNTENVFGESGSQAAAFDVGLDCGRSARNRAQPAPSVSDGWKEAAIAWEVCGSLHREYAKGKDPFFKKRQEDFVKHANYARTMLAAPEAKP